MDVEVTDNPDKARFEIVADGELAGFVQYHLRDGEIAFTHTQTDDRFRGHGLGGERGRIHPQPLLRSTSWSSQMLPSGSAKSANDW